MTVSVLKKYLSETKVPSELEAGELILSCFQISEMVVHLLSAIQAKITQNASEINKSKDAKINRNIIKYRQAQLTEKLIHSLKVDIKPLVEAIINVAEADHLTNREKLDTMITSVHGKEHFKRHLQALLDSLELAEQLHMQLFND